MVEIDRITFDVVPTGIGRRDFSQNVEQSVEPMIESWQEDYLYNVALLLPGFSASILEIDITEETVVMIYDLFLSVALNVLLILNVEAYVDGVWTPMAYMESYQTVKIHLSKGFPLFDKYRITITNYSTAPLVAYFSSHGIVTGEDFYHMRYGGGT